MGDVFNISKEPDMEKLSLMSWSDSNMAGDLADFQRELRASGQPSGFEELDHGWVSGGKGEAEGRVHGILRVGVNNNRERGRVPEKVVQ